MSRKFSTLILKLWCLNGSCKRQRLLLGFEEEQTNSCTHTSRAEVVDCNTVRAFLGIRLALRTTESRLQAPSNALRILGNINGREVSLEHTDSLPFTQSIHRRLLKSGVHLSVASPQCEGV